MRSGGSNTNPCTIPRRAVGLALLAFLLLLGDVICPGGRSFLAALTTETTDPTDEDATESEVKAVLCRRGFRGTVLHRRTAPPSPRRVRPLAPPAQLPTLLTTPHPGRTPPLRC
jgi:hypothetical protein